MEATIQVRQSGALTLPAEVQIKYGIKAGDTFRLVDLDGIFVLTRDYRPKNGMMKKMFDRYLDKSDSGAADLAKELGVMLENIFPVRLVSHHMRLLGVLSRRSGGDWLVLVDYEDTRK